jgi:hypothetical protein
MQAEAPGPTSFEARFARTRCSSAGACLLNDSAVACMREGICGASRKSAPGYRFTHPGYILHSVLARSAPVSETGVPDAIGQSADGIIAAKAKVLGARIADRPAALSLGKLEQ